MRHSFRKMVYVVSIGYSVQLDGAEIDYHTEYEYYESYDEALQALDRHSVGAVEFSYSDGADCVCDVVELNDNPQEFDFYA